MLLPPLLLLLVLLLLSDSAFSFCDPVSGVLSINSLVFNSGTGLPVNDEVLFCIIDLMPVVILSAFENLELLKTLVSFFDFSISLSDCSTSSINCVTLL